MKPWAICKDKEGMIGTGTEGGLLHPLQLRAVPVQAESDYEYSIVQKTRTIFFKWYILNGRLYNLRHWLLSPMILPFHCSVVPASGPSSASSPQIDRLLLVTSLCSPASMRRANCLFPIQDSQSLSLTPKSPRCQLPYHESATCPCPPRVCGLVRSFDKNSTSVTEYSKSSCFSKAS